MNIEQLYKFMLNTQNPTQYDVARMVQGVSSESDLRALNEMFNTLTPEQFNKLPKITQEIAREASAYGTGGITPREVRQNMRSKVNTLGFQLPDAETEGDARLRELLNSYGVSESALDAAYNGDKSGIVGEYTREALPLYIAKRDAQNALWESGYADTDARLQSMLEQERSAGTEDVPQVPTLESATTEAPAPAATSRGIVPIGSVQTLREATPTVGYSHTQSPFGSMVSDRRKVWQVDQDTVANPERVYSMAVPNPKSLEAAAHATAPIPEAAAPVSSAVTAPKEPLLKTPPKFSKKKAPTQPSQAITVQDLEALQAASAPDIQAAPPVQQLDNVEALAQLSSTPPTEALADSVPTMPARQFSPYATPEVGFTDLSPRELGRSDASMLQVPGAQSPSRISPEAISAAGMSPKKPTLGNWFKAVFSKPPKETPAQVPAVGTPAIATPAEELTAAVQQARASAPTPQATPRPSTSELASAARQSADDHAAELYKLSSNAPSKAELLSELTSTSAEAPKMLKGLRNPSAAGASANTLGDLATKLHADSLNGGAGSTAAGTGAPGAGTLGTPGAFAYDTKSGVSLGGKNVGKWMGGIGIGMNALGALGELDKMSKEGDRTGDLSNDVINASLASPMATYNLTPDQLKLLGEVRAGRVKNNVDAGDFDMSGMLSGALSGGLTGLTGGIPMAIAGAVVGGAKGGLTGLTQAKARKNAELEALYQALNQSNADYRARMQRRIDSSF